jgi:hypothetical protein
MPVIVNDFEIIVDPPGSAEAPPAPPPEAEPAQPLRPEHIAETERHLRRRAARVRAH